MSADLNCDLPNSIVYMTGAGGLSQSSINIATLSAIVASSTGLKIIKHVSYDSAKKCSSALFLESLSIKVSKNIKDIESDFEKNGIAFIEAMPEQVLDNLCPLVAPVNETCRFVGLNNYSLAMQYLFDLKSKHYKRAIVACSSDPMFDEVNVCGCTQIFELKNGEITNYVINPVDFGILEADSISLTGATPLYNSNLSLDILSKKIQGAKLDVITMNVGVMIYLSGAVIDIKRGIIMAYNAVNSLIALNKLERIRG